MLPEPDPVEPLELHEKHHSTQERLLGDGGRTVPGPPESDGEELEGQ